MNPKLKERLKEILKPEDVNSIIAEIEAQEAQGKELCGAKILVRNMNNGRAVTVDIMSGNISEPTEQDMREAESAAVHIEASNFTDSGDADVIRNINSEQLKSDASSLKRIGEQCGAAGHKIVSAALAGLAAHMSETASLIEAAQLESRNSMN